MSPIPDWSVAEHERRDAEIRAVCAEVAGLLGAGVPAQSIGIVARSLQDADVHLFNLFAAEHGFRTAAGEELPLIAQRLGRAAVAILKLRERDFRRADVIEILRDGFRTRTRINIDAADQETRKRHIAGGAAEELRARGEKSLVIGDYVNVVGELEELTATLAAVMLRGGQWSAILNAITARFSIRTRADLAAAQQLDDIAALFARADRMSIRFDVAAVVDAIDQASMSVSEDAGPLPAVWLGDVMRFRGRTFEHLFAVRMQDELFPQRRSEDPMLPDPDRRALSVREIGDGREEERLLFRLIVDGAASAVHFSFSGSDGFGKVLRPSQLLKNFVVEQEPERKQELLENFGKALAELRGHEVPGSREISQPRNLVTSRRQLQLIARSGSNGPFDGFITDPTLLEHFSSVLEHVSPTQLEDFGECPQKFLLKHILHVTDIEDPDRELEINVRDKGSLNHRILEHFYRGLPEAQRHAAQAQLPQLPPAVVTALEAEIDREFDRLAAEAPPFNRNVRDIERRASRRILRDFVASDLEDLASRGLVPRFFEYGFGDKYARRERGADHPEPFVITAAGIPMRVEGQIDRIDVSEGQEENRQYRIVDYKSGKALRHQKLAAKIERGVRLQLALYAMAVSNFFGIDPAFISGTVKPIAGGNPKQFAFELAEHADGVQQTLDTFARAIVRGMFPAFPDDEEIGSCKYCPVNETCRTRHDAEEAYAVAQSKDPRNLLRQIGALE